MKLSLFIKAFITSMILLTAVFSGSLRAHTGGAVLGADGTNPSATGLAAITCFDDGNGPGNSLVASIKDLSEPEPGLMISVQLYKGIKATNITDTISGDTNHSDDIELVAGNGVYWVMVNKTGPGARAFELIWHCLAENGEHTGTDIVVRQFQ